MVLRPLALTLIAGTFACTGGEDAPTDETDTDVEDTDETEDTDDTDPVTPGEVELTVYDRTTRTPDANEAVVFFDPDGSVVAEVTTDEAGKASATVGAGGTVVLMVRNGDGALAYTPVAYFGVQPGDRLSYSQGGPVQQVSDLSLPAAAEATEYRYRAACGEHTLRGSIGSSLPGAGAMPACEDASLIVVARKGTTLLGALGGTGIDATSAVTIEGPWVAPTAFELSATNLASETEEVGLEAQHALGAARTLGGTFGSGVPSARRYEVSGTMVPLDDLTVVVWATQQRTGYPFQFASLSRPYASDLSVDLADVTVPWLTKPELDLTDRTIRWTEDGEGEVDAILGGPFLRRGEVTFSWSIGAAPAGATELQLPLLPEPWTDYNPKVGDEIGGEYLFFRGEGLADAVRRDPVKMFDRFYEADVPGPQVDYGQTLVRIDLP